VVDPPDGHVPAFTPEAQALQAAAAAKRGKRPESWLDLTMYDRCVTRGVAGSIFPVIYGNGTQIVQAPGTVAIRNEMIHETRIIPVDARPHAPANERMNMGDSRGHWEGNTLVIETTNFSQGFRGSNIETYKMIEHITRVDATHLQREITFIDPKTWTKPWTVHIDMGKEADDSRHMIFDSACHEGNYGMTGILVGSRREEQAAAGKK